MHSFLVKCTSILLLLVMIQCIHAPCQHKIPLSEKHKQKIEQIEDPVKKLRKYRKYYSQDSIKYLRQLDRQLKRKSDSVFALMRKLESKRNDLAASPINATIKEPTNKLEQIKSEITPYQKYYEQYKNHLNNPDSMKAMIEKTARKELEQAVSEMVDKGQGMGDMKQFQEQQALADEIRDIPEKYQKQLKQYNDREFLREQGKLRLKESLAKFQEQHQDKITGIQKKMSRLKKVYSKVENSNDLSTAVKRSSLKGKPFKERLFVGTNFQVINLDPLSLDFSPSLGYMFNKKFIMGIGGTYRHTFGEYGANQNTTIPDEQYAVNAFVQHDVIKGFFAFATFEESNRRLSNQNADQAASTWVPGFMAGAGKAINIHPKINTSVVLLYNFLHEPGQSPYKSPWIFKTGFQLKKTK